MSGKRGFTLIEVVLAIAVGLIIIAGVSVGYGYAKRAAIIDNERKTVAAFRAQIEGTINANAFGWLASAYPSVNKQGCIFYLPASDLTTPFTVMLADGSSASYFGYVVVELDETGNIVAASGGNDPA